MKIKNIVLLAFLASAITPLASYAMEQENETDKLSIWEKIKNAPNNVMEYCFGEDYWTKGYVYVVKEEKTSSSFCEEEDDEQKKPENKKDKYVWSEDKETYTKENAGLSTKLLNLGWKLGDEISRSDDGQKLGLQAFVFGGCISGISLATIIGYNLVFNKQNALSKKIDAQKKEINQLNAIVAQVIKTNFPQMLKNKVK